MSERQAGWYWVRIAGHWRPCEWSDDYWIEPDFISGLGWDDFDEVGPRIPTPDEPWQCVPVEPTMEMVEQGAQAIVSWDDGCTWPESWGADAERHRKDCRKAYHAMLKATPTPS